MNKNDSIVINNWMYYPIINNMSLNGYLNFGGSKIIKDSLKKIDKTFGKIGRKYANNPNYDLTPDFIIIVDKIKKILSFCSYDENFSYREIESIFLYFACHYPNIDSTLIKVNFVNWFQQKYIETDKKFLSFVFSQNITGIQNIIKELTIIYRSNGNEIIKLEISKLEDMLIAISNNETSPGDIKK